MDDKEQDLLATFAWINSRLNGFSGGGNTLAAIRIFKTIEKIVSAHDRRLAECVAAAVAVIEQSPPGLPHPRPRRGRPPSTASLRQVVKDAVLDQYLAAFRADGRPLSDIAAELGASESKIERRLRALNRKKRIKAYLRIRRKRRIAAYLEARKRQ